MTGFGSWFFVSFFGRFLLKSGNGRRGRGGVDAVDDICLKCKSGKLQHDEDGDFFTLGVEFPCGFFVETVFEQGSDIEIGRRFCRHRQTLYSDSKFLTRPIFSP